MVATIGQIDRDLTQFTQTTLTSPYVSVMTSHDLDFVSLEAVSILNLPTIIQDVDPLRDSFEVMTLCDEYLLVTINVWKTSLVHMPLILSVSKNT